MLCGVDQLFLGELAGVRRRLRSGRIALLSHAAAVDRNGRETLLTLEELGASPELLFTPEHGYHAIAQAEEPVSGADFAPTDVRSRSLYGDGKASLSPSAEDLTGIDLLVIDLCDIGSRYYTYIWTAALAMRAAAQAGIHTLVLDRPNPISAVPELLEGKPQEPEYLSFVGLEPVPVRHGLTLGEMLCSLASRDGLALGPEGALSVVPVRGWERHQTASAWNRPFSAPSPNIPTLETALVYPGACLLEGTNLSEGRGTTLPFQLVGAPFVDKRRLFTELSELGTPGAQVRPVSFRPSFSKYQGQVCHGLLVQVQQFKMCRPLALYLSIVNLVRQQAPEAFEFLKRPYEFETDKPAFDLLLGSDAPRKAVLEGVSTAELLSSICPVDDSYRENLLSAEALAQKAQA